MHKNFKPILFFIVNNICSKSYNVSFDVPFNEDSGLRYLLKYNEVPVSRKDSDPLVEFVCH
jgi:hypothetical protein